MGINWAGVTATVSALTRTAAHAPRLVVPGALRPHPAAGQLVDLCARQTSHTWTGLRLRRTGLQGS